MKHEIKICMGSSCYARGNNDNLELIENYIKENNLSAKIDLYGNRCENICETGPNIIIDNIVYNNMTGEKIIEKLKELS